MYLLSAVRVHLLCGKTDFNSLNECIEMKFPQINRLILSFPSFQM